MLRVEKEVLEAGGRCLVQGENWKHVHAPLRITLASTPRRWRVRFPVRVATSLNTIQLLSQYALQGRYIRTLSPSRCTSESLCLIHSISSHLLTGFHKLVRPR